MDVVVTGSWEGSRHTWGIFKAKEVLNWLILLRLGLGAQTMSLPRFPQPCHLSR